MVKDKISKREARKLYNSGLDFLIGGVNCHGEGAWWSAFQFKEPNFDSLCTMFEDRYCRGRNRIIKMEYYTKS